MGEAGSTILILQMLKMLSDLYSIVKLVSGRTQPQILYRVIFASFY